MRVDSDTKQRAFSVSKRQRGCQGHSSLDVTCPCVDTESRHCLGWAAALQKHPARCLAFLPDLQSPVVERIAPPLALQSGHSVRAARHFPSITVCFLAIIPGVHRVLTLIQPLVRHSADTGLMKDLFQPPLLLPHHCRPQDTLDHDQRRSSPCRGYAARRLSLPMNQVIYCYFWHLTPLVGRPLTSSESLLAARAFFRRSRIALAVVSCMSQSTTKHTTKNVCIWLTIPLSYIKNVSFLTYNYF